MFPHRSCPHCGFIPSLSARFCGSCGAQLPQQRAINPTVRSPVSPGARSTRRSFGLRKPHAWLLGLLLLVMGGLVVGFTSWYWQPTAESGQPGAVVASTSVPPSSPTPLPPPTLTAPSSQPSRAPTTGAETLAVHFIDVGQGDSILIQAPDGTTALIDGGYDNGQALDYLRAHQIQHIDLMIASHPHADHIGGLVEVLQALPVGAVWTSGATHTTGIFEQFLDAIAEVKTPYHEAQRGDIIPLGELGLTVLRSDPQASDLNDTSLVLKLTYGQVSFLFTGDAESASEAALLQTATDDLRSTILKVGHHGSYTSSSPAFLAAVQPQVAIYSAGRHNSYGHPHTETLTALQAVSAQIYGTDIHGPIVVHTDGQDYQIQTTRQADSNPESPHAPMPSPMQPSRSSQPAPTPGSAASPDPSGPDVNCGNFATHAEAQAFFLAAGGPQADPHRLDGDNDGSACEALP